MMAIGMVESKRQHLFSRLIPRMRPNFSTATVLTSLRHGRRQGPRSKGVEAGVASRIGVPHVILTPSGRGGLFLLLHCLPQGRVCIPGYTCSAVTEAASLAGREITYLEHSSGSINLTAGDIDGKLRPGDIFLLTHQYGYAGDVVQIIDCAKRQGAIVIEDIAAAFAGTFDGKPLGSFGLAAFGSFDTSKLVHVPLKGGFVATSDDVLATALRTQAKSLFRKMSVWHMLKLVLLGCIQRLVTKPALYWLFHALNFRLRGKTTAEDGFLAKQPNAFYTTEFSEWQAAIALQQLQQLDEIIRRRAGAFRVLHTKCYLHASFGLEKTSAEVAGATVRFPVYATGDKTALYRRLVGRGVDCGFSFTKLATPRSYTESWRIADSVLNFPYYPTMTSLELETLSNVLSLLGAQENA